MARNSKGISLNEWRKLQAEKNPKLKKHLKNEEPAVQYTKSTESKRTPGNKNRNNNNRQQKGINKNNCTYQQTNSPKEYFINPYSFIPIPDEDPDRRKASKGDLTGVLDCSIEIVSPIFIPNTTKRFEREVTDHYYYEFYSYDDLNKKGEGIPEMPVIPGSAIRGMVRNIYEQLTNSCFLHIDEENLPYKRTPQPKEPGVLIYNKSEGKWQLYYNLKRNEDYYQISKYDAKKLQQGEVCKIINKKPVANKDGDFIIHLTGDFPSKKNAIAFRQTQHGQSIMVNEKSFERLENVVLSYCNPKINKKGNTLIYEKYYLCLKNKKPVFVYASNVLDADNVIYLSPSCITKEYFENTISDILLEQNKHNCCTDNKNMCPACRLFGMIGENGSCAGRLRFTDTYENNNTEFAAETVLPILSKPQISATEFYLERPQNNTAKIWNYDYWLDYENEYIDGKKRIKYIRTKEMPKLRGRKVYWHGSFKDSGQIKKTNMNCSIRPLTAGKFKFKVFFEDLTADELKNLVFALTLNNKGIHKIGKGKPIGMGDIKVAIDWDNSKYHNYKISDNIVKIIDKKIIETEKAQKEFLLPESDAAVKYILTYTLPMKLEEKKIVEYPSVMANDSKIFKWFCSNRGLSIITPSLQQTLPELSSDDKRLKKY